MDARMRGYMDTWDDDDGYDGRLGMSYMCRLGGVWAVRHARLHVCISHLHLLRAWVSGLAMG